MLMRLLIIMFALGALDVGAGAADRCDLPAATLAGFDDGALLAQNDAGDWLLFTGFENLKKPTPFSFAFVVKDGMERAGVVVVKTARWGSRQSASRSGLVKLARENSYPDRQCSSPPFKSRSVTARAYEDYHGRGFLESRALDSSPDPASPETSRQVIESFHSKYPGGGSCRSSDSTDYAGFEYRNNRSQFSYDMTVVDNGWSYATVNIARSLIPEALAAPSRLQQQRTEIFHYKVAPNRPTCIMFSLDSAAADQVLRVNDIENRTTLWRAGEKRWQPLEVR
ncbi:hypothetical protein [Bradyrhizobium mercantei]|uniref:hypothetical protein n=1 Tax=Bradyrhizobium mercantei TaxID=1904807 RepID=UPI000976DDDD|nr:hypothetical protein [Bradyrhizobium mercantei]